jgi:alkylation response protein AidB-like acyl-CoA dehydrogenase
MYFTYNGKESAIQQTAKAVTKILPDRFAPTDFRSVWKQMSQTGIPAAFLQQGKSLSLTETSLALEAMASEYSNGGFLFSLAAHLFAGLLPLSVYADEKIKSRIENELIQGDFILANAMTESASGSDAFAMKTIAVRDGNGYRIDGSKIFCTNAPVADAILVYAVTNRDKGFFGGISCFLLEKKKHGYRVGNPISKPGLSHSPMAEVFLDHVFVEEENRIGKEGAGALIFLHSMNAERAGMAAMHAGTMARLCSETVVYAKEKQRGKNHLTDFQAVQFRIAEMHLQTELARLLSYKALHAFDSGKDSTIEAAQAKILASEALLTVANNAMQIFGGNGFTSAYSIAETLADAQASTIYSGPNDVLRDLISSRL